MRTRSGILRRIANEGSFGIHMIFRAGILSPGFLLTLVFDKAGFFRYYLTRRFYYNIYVLGKLFVDSDKINLIREMLKELLSNVVYGIRRRSVLLLFH